METLQETDLRQFTGTDHYYPSDFGRLQCTDGVQYLRLKGAAWLITAIESYQPTLEGVSFQLWTLTVAADKTAVLTCKEDSGAAVPVLAAQEIPYTDFPLPSIKIYVVGGVCLLPSEY